MSKSIFRSVRDFWWFLYLKNIFLHFFKFIFAYFMGKKFLFIFVVFELLRISSYFSSFCRIQFEVVLVFLMKRKRDYENGVFMWDWSHREAGGRTSERERERQLFNAFMWLGSHGLEKEIFLNIATYSVAVSSSRGPDR